MQKTAKRYILREHLERGGLLQAEESGAENIFGKKIKKRLTKSEKFGNIDWLTETGGVEGRRGKLLEKYIVMRRTRGQNKTKI